MQLSFFRLSDDTPTALNPTALAPTDLARSMWDDDQMHGVAVSGALARGVEERVRELGRDDLLPARYTVDLFAAARMRDCTVTTEVVREGPRICLVDAVLTQVRDGVDVRVARASALFLKPTASTGGSVWSPESRPSPPPLDLAPVSSDGHVPYFHSSAGWSQSFGLHQNDSRKSSWHTAVAIVDGEPRSPFQAVASIADGASLVTNWGDRGIEYINTDITLTLARQPDGVSIGLAAVDRVEVDGVAVGTATVFDRSGPLGTAVVTSLANAKRVVDLGGVEYTDDGERRTTA
ncbi:acyl-CoA thioesterase domain-containing protein [Nocardioides sp. W7]|uniref:acyl-CoA thioesterase domain-containing protein n=1 Tax=Nocardioides sp. W7 TaxID=2931390 RepID=UPI001FD1D391|nr:acyl-CoA thioesterase domain-containing protein [Nocardioides sp. W7]